MLKIIDEYDLKELENYGWQFWEWRNCWYKGKFTIQKNRHIRSKAGNQWNGLDDLFDLIKLGIVEKVGE